MQPRSRASSPVVAAFFVLLILVGLALIVVAIARNSPAPAPTGGIAVTIYPTQPLPTPIPAAPIVAPTEAPTVEPTPTPRVTQYVVQPNDTLWDIAIRFGFTTLDAIIAANPGINPDFLSLGQVINIPGADFVPPPRPQPTVAPVQPQQPAPSYYVMGQVLPDAGGLRLRAGPSYESNVITRLGPNTELKILGQVAGQSWLKVITPNGTEGYVDARYVSIGGTMTLPTSSALDAPLVSAVIPGPLEYPYLSDISPRVYQIFQVGQARGNRANAFSVVGDSNSQHPAFLKPFDWGNYNLGSYGYLRSTVDFFRGSFANDSPAAAGGFNTAKVLDPAHAPSYCNGQSPLECEYNRTRPSVALILLGTGDQHNWQSFEGNYRRIIEISINMGVIPVLITKADDLESRDNNAPYGFINGKIAQLAREYQVPLLNLRQVVQRLPNGGTTGDGFHYNYPGDNRSAWFTPDYLQYGYNQRNLTALQVLDVLRRKVIQPGT
ncbi:MAG: SH3 domain-containing protein [Anaerolineae bacterium]|nr:SH3 domain-containing protein [Anaerolineae bacterium]